MLQAVLPGDFAFGASDNGTHTFTGGVTLKTAGSRTVTATDTVSAGINGTSGPSPWSPPRRITLQSRRPQRPPAAGSAFSTTVVAKDAYGNTALTYAGTVNLTSGDAQAVLPSFTYGAGDNGSHVFSTTLKTSGAQTITASDGSSTGSANVTVGHAAAAGLHRRRRLPQAAGSSFSATVTAEGRLRERRDRLHRHGDVDLEQERPAGESCPRRSRSRSGTPGVISVPVTLKTAGSKSLTATSGSVTGSRT